MTEDQLGIITNCVAYGTGTINSATADGFFSDYDTSFRENPHFSLMLVMQSMITSPEIIRWLNVNGYQGFAAVLEEHKRLSSQAPPNFNKLCTEMIAEIRDPEDIIGNILIASTVSSFFDDGADFAQSYLDKVMETNTLKIIIATKEEFRFLMLLYSALWNCDFESFRETALSQLY